MKTIDMTIEMNDPTRMMLYHFVDGPDKFVAHDHKRLFWYLSKKKSYDLIELVTMMDYLVDHPVDASKYNYGSTEDIAGADAMFVVSQLEVMVQSLAIEKGLTYVDVLRAFAAKRRKYTKMFTEYLATDDPLPDAKVMAKMSAELSASVKKTVVTKLLNTIRERGGDIKEIMRGVQEGKYPGIASDLGENGVGMDSLDSDDLDSWGTEQPVDKRKLN